MSFSQISLAHLSQNGFDSVTFSLLGMLFVFAGLVIIAVYIVLLPKILRLLQKKPSTSALQSVDTDSHKQKEILLAITTALHLHQNFPEGSERITWKSHGDIDSPWLVSGRVHGLSVRKDIQTWRKS